MQSCGKIIQNISQATDSVEVRVQVARVLASKSSAPSCAPVQHALEAGYVPLQQIILETPTARQLQQKLMFR